MFWKLKKFIAEVIVELKKVSWPSRQEVLEATWLVLLSSAMVGIYIGVIDFALSKFLGLLIR